MSQHSSVTGVRSGPHQQGGRRGEEEDGRAGGETARAQRDVVVAAVALAALCTPPVLVPDVVAQLHTLTDGFDALGLGGAALGHVVLFLRALGPVGRGGPEYLGQAAVLLVLARLDGAQAF